MPRNVIRLSELATTPATPAKPAEPGGRKKPKPARPAKPGLLPVSGNTIWRWVREGKFPKPFKLGDSVTVWDADEVAAFIASRAGAEHAEA